MLLTDGSRFFDLCPPLVVRAGVFSVAAEGFFFWAARLGSAADMSLFCLFFLAGRLDPPLDSPDADFFLAMTISFPDTRRRGVFA